MGVMFRSCAGRQVRRRRHMTLKWGLLCEKTEKSSKAMPPVTTPPCPSPASPGPPTLLGLRPHPPPAPRSSGPGGPARRVRWGGRRGERSYRSCNLGTNFFFWLLHRSEEGGTGRGGPFRTSFFLLVTHNAIR